MKQSVPRLLAASMICGALLLEARPVRAQAEPLWHQVPTQACTDPLDGSDNWPTGRSRCQLFYSRSRGRLCLFGGYAPGVCKPLLPAPRYIWEWGDREFRGGWRAPLDSRRAVHSYISPMAVLDDDRQRIISLDGTHIWEYDLAAETWEDHGAHGIPQRANAALTPTDWGPILFGGDLGPNDFNDTWIYDDIAGTGRKWRHLTGLTPPAGRRPGALAWDDSRARLWLCGGLRIAGGQSWLADLWSASVSRLDRDLHYPIELLWNRVGDAGNPSDGQMFYDPSFDRIIHLQDGYESLDVSVWYPRSGRWYHLAFDAASFPPPRVESAAALDLDHQILYLFGGYTAEGGLEGPRNDLWALSTATLFPDSDLDGIPDEFDNCPHYPNPEQVDVDADGCPDNVVFVSASLGNDANPGNADTPVRTLPRAVELAGERQPHADIHVHSGEYQLEETLVITDDMSLLGGFDVTEAGGRVAGWTRSEALLGLREPRSEISGATTALRVTGISSPTVIDGFTIRSRDGAFREGESGESSIAIRVENATEALSITHCSIAAGSGAPGAAGQNGALAGDSPSHGKKGEDWKVFAGLTELPGFFEDAFAGKSPGQLLEGLGTSRGGEGGDAGCAGDGGKGGTSSVGIVEDLFAPAHGASGHGPGGGLGGYGGDRTGDGDPDPTGGPAELICALVDSGTAGDQGHTGGTGSPGEGGSGGTGDGVLEGGLWRGVSGTDGLKGGEGSGGGGGGAGMGGACAFIIPAPPGFVVIPMSGGGGGGGGAGGCGGGGGRCGKGGGASCGILLEDASPVLDHIVISTAGGGAGGAGGSGVAGSPGVPGGDGGTGSENEEGTLASLARRIRGFACNLCQAETHDGGRGAAGGGGGSGGGGGGGGGGPSCDIVRLGSSSPVVGEICTAMPCPWDPSFLSVPCPSRVSLLGHGGRGGPGGDGGPGAAAGEAGLDGAECVNGCPRPIVPICIPPGGTSSSLLQVPAGSGGLIASGLAGGGCLGGGGGGGVGPELPRLSALLSLVSPTGRTIDRDTIAADVVHALSFDRQAFRVSDPEAGAWTIRLTADSRSRESRQTFLSLRTEARNRPPVPVAGPDREIECGSLDEIILDGTESFDPEGGPLTLEWLHASGALLGSGPTVVVPLHVGESVYRLRASDGKLTAEDSVTIRVVDATPPVITLSDTLISAVGDEQGVTLDISSLASTEDSCEGLLTTTNDSPGRFFPGRKEVTFRAVDGSGNASEAIAIVVVTEPQVLVPPPSTRHVLADCTGDGTLDISDPVCTLGFLFTGTPSRLPCGDGSATHTANIALLDMQPDGRIDLSDAVAVLNFLFAGGAPHPFAGSAPGSAECVWIPGCPDACRSGP